MSVASETVPNLDTNPSGPFDVLGLGKILGLKLESTRIKCLGRKAKDTTPCGIRVDRKAARTCLAKLEGERCVRSEIELERLLEELASCLLCVRWHRDQTQEKAKQWLSIITTGEPIKQAETEGTVTPVRPSTPVSTRESFTVQLRDLSTVETPLVRNGDVWIKRSSSPEGHIIISRDQTETPTRRLRSYRSPSSSKKPLEQRRFEISNPSTPEFEPFKANDKPRNMLQRFLDVMEKECTAKDGEGYIYVYTRESSPGHVKIGRTASNVHNRVETQAKGCKFTAKLVEGKSTHTKVRYHKKVERLVHAFLAPYRKKELVCNRGRGCWKGRQHEEWFEVDSSYAVQVVDLFHDFVAAGPYVDHKLRDDLKHLPSRVFGPSESKGDYWDRHWTHKQIILLPDWLAQAVRLQSPRHLEIAHLNVSQRIKEEEEEEEEQEEYGFDDETLINGDEEIFAKAEAADKREEEDSLDDDDGEALVEGQFSEREEENPVKQESGHAITEESSDAAGIPSSEKNDDSQYSGIVALFNPERLTQWAQLGRGLFKQLHTSTYDYDPTSTVPIIQA
ncbi:MAG: hypothetical protein M1825_001992 [Sarcosagium campestre]|nr:MAG: hypothetical protein M1825_001992 [Sarcosagium campestre]